MQEKEIVELFHKMMVAEIMGVLVNVAFIAYAIMGFRWMRLDYLEKVHAMEMAEMDKAIRLAQVTGGLGASGETGSLAVEKKEVRKSLEVERQHDTQAVAPPVLQELLKEMRTAPQKDSVCKEAECKEEISNGGIEQ